MPLSKNSKKGAGPRDESPEAGPSRRDKYSSDEDDEPTLKKGDKHHSSKMSKQCATSKKSPGISKQMGGHGAHNKPAELFRKDLISAMKLPDTEILYEDEYVVISDPWRQEWEKGVQVPVNEEEIPVLSIMDVIKSNKGTDFKIPQRKYMHERNDETYQSLLHELTGMQEFAEQIVRYDLDDQDVTWLNLVNEDREEMGLQLINEWNLERMIEELENQCYVKTNAVKKTEEGLGIEYDEDIACDVCRMLESEDTNEMVFCDGCDICVHQACYGIQTIPEGSWRCRICVLGIKPMCLLCPKRGGAMKSTRSGTKWTHVSCALWIPEVSIGCPEKMEPITKISNIPASRWALVCCLCKERVGACIQCSVKQCKTAFHVTCGFAHNLDMKTILDDTDELDGIHLRAYCPKHTKNRNASDSESPKKDEEEEDEADNENDVNEAEMAKQRAEKLKQLDEEFYTLIDVHEIATKFYIPEEAVDIVAEYWKLKRKVNNNKPLITPKMEEEDQMQKQQKDSLSARMKMFVHLRQDLERARNLCYMIGKREKTKKQLFNFNESVFRSQVSVLIDSNSDLSARDADRVRQEYKFNSLYCTLNNAWSKSSKAPRKNLFTLENLKTPKDFNEVDSESINEKSMNSKKVLKSTAVETIKKEPSVDSVGEASEESNSVRKHRENLFSTDNLKVLSDTTADSSEDEFASCDDGAKSKTDSAQMSRLGKVKAEEIETNVSEEKVDEKKSLQVDVKSKKNAGSDLKMRLTSILQSKSLMQKQEKSNETGLESLNQALHIDVENSDSEVFTDNYTDFVSPDQPRNLFDKFERKGFSGKPDLSSPDMPRSSKYSSKRKKRRKGHAHKRKKQSLVHSPSDQSSLSSNSLKQEATFSIDIDSRSVSADCSSLLSDHTDREKSIISPISASEASESLSNEKVPDSNYRHCSPFKQRKSKKRSHADRDASSPEPVKSLRSSSIQKTPKISPSPRVDPVNAYCTIDGDIYVPSGKIHVTERTIVLDSPKEERSRVQRKLRLKKQANSPIKGIVSYEVVNNDFSDCAPVNKSDVKNDDTIEDKTDNKKRDNDNEQLESVQQPQDTHELDSNVLSPPHQKLREKNRKSETRHSKLLSDSFDNVTKVIRDYSEESNKKDSHEIIIEKPPSDKEKLQRRSLRSVAVKSHEPGYSSDENFVPTPEMPKSPAVERSQRPHRQRTSHRLHNDTDGGDSDAIHSPSSNRKRPHHHNSSPIMKLNPFPNRPELNAIIDGNKLVVKDSVKRHVGDHLSRMLKRHGKWGRRDQGQLTLDSFVKPVEKNENIFAKIDVQSEREISDSSVSSHDLTTPSSGQWKDTSGKKPDSVVSSSVSLNLPANGNVFGIHSSPRKISNNPSANTRSINAESKEGNLVFGEMSSVGMQASFKEISTRSPLREEMKTPTKCDPSVLNNECVDISRTYRCHSPLSSEGSEASSRNPMADSRESTPRRTTRNRTTEHSRSPIAPGRLRNRDALVKSSPFKSS